MRQNFFKGRQAPEHPELAEALKQLAALAEQQPELAAAARLQVALLRAAYAAPAPVGALDLSDHELQARLGRGVPLLAEARLPIAERHLRETLLRLIDSARDHQVEGLLPLVAALREGRVEALALAHALLGQGESEAGIVRLGVAPGPARTLLRIALLPFLEQLAAQLKPRRSALSWSQGYCPSCGAWPTLGEQRGLDQTRYLRCGLCASAWPRDRVLCAFCGNRDHDSLGYLQVAEEAQRQRVATCTRCGHYLKLRSTIGALSAPQLLAEEIALLHLDMIALDAGFTPP